MSLSDLLEVCVLCSLPVGDKGSVNHISNRNVLNLWDEVGFNDIRLSIEQKQKMHEFLIR